MVATQERSTVL
ncbi:unnamed protein product [Acanthoscelides obtectus]|uniref:Uncharacterized protein n=1 Tax=Acanthoscelides obtectus TaxID=200917 RepID=A0A9P0JZM3_ACAOB|nr:unnamed protein product [Acanthoscelides obtectus]CAK1663991.1 hypothetical protein AOBTE_LOCUS23990 [Acanthoscelides obtectus]